MDASYQNQNDFEVPCVTTARSSTEKNHERTSFAQIQCSSELTMTIFRNDGVRVDIDEQGEHTTLVCTVPLRCFYRWLQPFPSHRGSQLLWYRSQAIVEHRQCTGTIADTRQDYSGKKLTIRFIFSSS